MTSTAMPADLSYNTIHNVIESWEALKRHKNFEQVAGEKLFECLIERHPEARTVFSIPFHFDPKKESEDEQSKHFVQHAVLMIRNFDMALHFLGPDMEFLYESMYELGIKHMRYGVKPEMFPAMGEALIEMLQEVLREKFTAATKKSWEEVYIALSHNMIQAQKDYAKK